MQKILVDGDVVHMEAVSRLFLTMICLNGIWGNRETHFRKMAQSEDAVSTDELEAYYQNGKICIYNYEQLQQIGSGNQVHTGDIDGNIGTGDAVKNAGTVLTYSADAQYLLMNDIEMDNSQIWTVADSFTRSNYWRVGY
ncbi:MAG: hypothetical protein ACLUD0_05775 [Eubacterium ramulus]